MLLSGNQSCLVAPLIVVSLVNALLLDPHLIIPINIIDVGLDYVSVALATLTNVEALFLPVLMQLLNVAFSERVHMRSLLLGLLANLLLLLGHLFLVG